MRALRTIPLGFLAFAAAGCGPSDLSIAWEDSMGQRGYGLLAAWHETPPPLPLSLELTIKASDDLGSATLRLVGDEVCEVTRNPVCFDGECTAELLYTGYGICMARVVGFSNGVQVPECWYRAIFDGSAEIEEQKRAIDKALGRCEDLR